MLPKIPVCCFYSVISKHSSEATRNGLYHFFRFAAEDLISTVQNVTSSGKFTHVKTANIPRNSMVYNYVPGVLVHVLHSLFEHLSQQDDGQELLCKSKTVEMWNDVIVKIHLFAT